MRSTSWAHRVVTTLNIEPLIQSFLQADIASSDIIECTPKNRNLDARDTVGDETTEPSVQEDVIYEESRLPDDIVEGLELVAYVLHCVQTSIEDVEALNDWGHMEESGIHYASSPKLVQTRTLHQIYPSDCHRTKMLINLEDSILLLLVLKYRDSSS